MRQRKIWIDVENVLQLVAGVLILTAVVKLGSEIGPDGQRAWVESPGALKGTLRGGETLRSCEQHTQPVVRRRVVRVTGDRPLEITLRFVQVPIEIQVQIAF